MLAIVSNARTIGIKKPTVRCRGGLGHLQSFVEVWILLVRRSSVWHHCRFRKGQFAPIREATIFHCPASKNSNPKAWTDDPLAIGAVPVTVVCCC